MSKRKIIIGSISLILLLLSCNTGNNDGINTKKEEKSDIPNNSDAKYHFNLGMQYHTGSDEFDIDKRKAYDLFYKSAELGNADAQYNLGVMHYFGEETPIDKKRALYWYEKSAEKGNENAQFNLALMYANGEETPIDKKKALYWFEKSAEQGQPMAQLNAGIMYMTADGVKYDEEKAEYWILTAKDNEIERANEVWNNFIKLKELKQKLKD